MDQAPPFKAPLKFFLTAPLFAIFAAIFLLFGDNFATYTPYMISAVHLVTLGFMVMIIFGALQQMLPVIAGAVIAKAKITANITYYSLILGLVLFAIAFILYEKVLFFLSAILLLFSLLYFCTIALVQLIKVPNKSYIVQGLIFALVFFLIAFLAGIYLLISHATGNISELHNSFTLIHYNYIFFGFIFLLIVSITIQVVPMFWVCGAYSKNLQKYLIYSLVLVLVAYPFVLLLAPSFVVFLKILLIVIASIFAFVTIFKLRNRKRKLQDISVNFYTISMVFLVVSMIYYFCMIFFDLKVEVFAILLGLGFVISLMTGMLYKIVPFLTWFHLNALGIFDIPTLRDMIPMKRMQLHYYLHLIIIVLFLVGFLQNSDTIIKIAALFFIVSNSLFFLNLYNAAKIYLQKGKK